MTDRGITDERRRVARDIRNHNDNNVLENLFGMSDEALADLIDPTCEVVGTVTIKPAQDGMVVWKLWELSCGHEAVTEGGGRPGFCPVCGARIVRKEDE